MFQFFFQSGQFESEQGTNWTEVGANCLTTFLVGALTAFITYYVFKQGEKRRDAEYKRELEKKENEKLAHQREIKEERRREDIQKIIYLLMLIQGVGKAVGNHTDSLRKATLSNALVGGKVPSFSMSYWNDLRRLNNLPDHKEYYTSFTNVFSLRQENTNTFHSLFQNSEDLLITIEQYQIIYEGLEAEGNYIHALMLESIEKTTRIIQEFYPSNVSGGMTPFIKKWTEEFEKNNFDLDDIENIRILDFMSTMVLPFFEECSSFMDTTFHKAFISTNESMQKYLKYNVKRLEFLSSSMNRVIEILSNLSPIEALIRRKLLDELNGDPIIDGYEIVDSTSESFEETQTS